MQNTSYIAYYRVSTARQGQSGLGLEAQQRAVENYINDGELIAEYTEVETGKGANALKKRPKLSEAIAECKKHKAILLIAKLDRLARNVAFISALMENKIEFVCCDNPNATPLTLHILAAVAEDETRRISHRTKEALAAAKERGVELGKNGTHVLSKQNKTSAEEFAKSLVVVVKEIKQAGYLTVRDVTDQLNGRSIPTATNGSKWHLPTVHRLLKRIEALT